MEALHPFNGPCAVLRCRYCCNVMLNPIFKRHAHFNLLHICSFFLFRNSLLKVEGKHICINNAQQDKHPRNR